MTEIEKVLEQYGFNDPIKKALVAAIEQYVRKAKKKAYDKGYQDCVDYFGSNDDQKGLE